MGLAGAYEFLHSYPALFAITEVAFAHGLPDEFGHRCLFPASAGVERSPQLVVEIQLSPSHDVYYTSSAPAHAQSSIAPQPTRLQHPKFLETKHFWSNADMKARSRSLLKFLTVSLLAVAALAQTASLAGIKKIYVEPMPNDLDQYIRSEFY